MNHPCLPDGLEHVRTTDIFDNDTVGVASLAQLEKLFKAVNGRSSPYQKPARRPSCALYPHGIKS